MNGMAILEKDDVQTKAVFIEQEALERARLNVKAKKNAAERDRKQKEADDSRRKAEKAEARRMAYNASTVKYLATRCIISGVMAGGWYAGLIHPVIAAPIALICLCAASMRLGEWRARTYQREGK